MLLLILPNVLTSAHTIAAPSSATSSHAAAAISVRVAQPHELVRVAGLQLDIFAPPPEPPPMLPVFAAFLEANQRNARSGMLKRLTDELQKRVDKGSEILIALDESDEATEDGVVDASGQYVEPGQLCARATRARHRGPVLGDAHRSLQALCCTAWSRALSLSECVGARAVRVGACAGCWARST